MEEKVSLGRQEISDSQEDENDFGIEVGDEVKQERQRTQVEQDVCKSDPWLKLLKFREEYDEDSIDKEDGEDEANIEIVFLPN